HHVTLFELDVGVLAGEDALVLDGDLLTLGAAGSGRALDGDPAAGAVGQAAGAGDRRQQRDPLGALEDDRPGVGDLPQAVDGDLDGGGDVDQVAGEDRQGDPP